jgi:sensor c-di-GMP phosphodiesterase-like protein
LLRFQKYKFLVAFVSILSTAGPVVWFVSWLHKQGETEVSIAANWSILNAELSIDQAVANLSDLVGRGVDSCQPAHLEMLRQAVFRSGPVKEVAVIGPNGETLCTDTGNSFGRREVVVSAATPNPDIMLDVVSISDGHERMLRVRRLAPRGKPALAASLPANLLLPRVNPEGTIFSGFARMTLADGTTVGVAGVEGTTPDDHIIGRHRSERYGLIVTVALARNGVIANYDDLRRIGMVVTGLVALVIFICAIIVPWRQRYDPISEVERALVANEFVPYYQPVVDIKSGRILGAEVLVRWRKPDGTIVNPHSFISLIESSGLILELTRALMRRVSKEVGLAIGARPHMYIAFNIAPRHFADLAILGDIGSIFDGSSIGLPQLVLEITERYEIENLTATRRVIAALQGLGCRIAIDDVGTGHNGLSYLRKLGADIIKIDKMFVEAIKYEHHSRAIVEMLVDLARNLHMQIIAEGVETFEQIIFLRELGISAVQGYVFAPPLPGSAFLQLVEAIHPLSPETAEEKVADQAQSSASALSPLAA